MIFYFSATGNCKYVATHLAAATNDSLVSIAECLKTGRYHFVVKREENIGFVTPTYFWGLPSVVDDFLQRLTIGTSGAHYVYHVLTYGTTTGQAHKMLDRHLRKNSLHLDGRFGVRMPDTWTPVFDLSDSACNEKVLAQAEVQIDTVVERV